jgi:hypothetical protein
MNDNEANRRMHTRMQEELAEANDPRNVYQKRIDAWWESQRELDWEENDYYEVGGFQERWSQMPSFTKGRRDRDWRVR